MARRTIPNAAQARPDIIKMVEKGICRFHPIAYGVNNNRTVGTTPITIRGKATIYFIWALFILEKNYRVLI
jgi:hypothetical protein